MEKFEELCLPYLKSFEEPAILILDEIGKMELLSKSFRKFIENCSNLSEKSLVIATVPLESRDPLILNLKKSCNNIFHVNINNRNIIYEDIFKAARKR